MSDNTFKKSPTAFLQNRLSMNRLIQNGSKKRIEKAIEYLKTNPETGNPADSGFTEINKNLNQQVDRNKAVVDGNCPVWNPNRFKSAAKLRIKTPGFRENSAVYEDAFYPSVIRDQGELSSACGVAPYFVKNLKDEVRQLDSATFIKVNCGTTPTIYAHLTAGNAHKFLVCTDLYPETDEYLTWTNGTDTVYTPEDEYYDGYTLYSDTALTTVAGSVEFCFVDDEYAKPMLAGMFRSIELDDTVGQTNYYGWFYFGNLRGVGFTQIYTKKEKPDVDDPIYLRSIHTGDYIEFPSTFKVASWSSPATMFDVDYEFEYSPAVVVDEPDYKKDALVAELKEVDEIRSVASITPAKQSIKYNLRALVSGYSYVYYTTKITVVVPGETPTTLGTFNFDGYEGHDYQDVTRWVNVDETAAQKYVYTWFRNVEANDGVCSDSGCGQYIGMVSTTVISDTPEEKIMYMAFAAPQGNYTDPDRIIATMSPNYSVDPTTQIPTDRREMTFDTVWGVDINPYITEKWWATANIGYGEVSSQTTLYTETVFRYKDLDAHLKDYLPADWEGPAYGCIIEADSSSGGKFGGEMFLGVSHTEFFQDGSDVYYIIPTNVNAGKTGAKGPYDLVLAYVYNAALNSIYSTNFAIDTTDAATGTVTTHHYISDATGNYQVNGAWRYHYACVEDKTSDIWTKRLAYDFTDLYYIDSLGREVPLNKNTQVLVTPQLFPYATIYQDNNTSTSGICAWYDFAHTDITHLTGFKFRSTFKPNQLTVTPTGGNAVTVNRYKIWDEEGFFAWEYVNGETYTYVYTESDQPAVGATVFSDTKGTVWGTVTTLVSLLRDAWRVSKFDTTKEEAGVTHMMYAWEFYVDPEDEWSGCWNCFTEDTLSPTITTPLWVQDGKDWAGVGATPSSLTNTVQTWYRYHTSQKETYYVDEEEHERFAAVWATSRNPYSPESVLVHSNYSLSDPSIPTSPDIDNTIDYHIDYQAYIAPAYQMTVTYKGEDYTFTADYSAHDEYAMEFNGVLYSSWVCDDFNGVFYTARITPRVGDLLYTYEKENSAVAEGFVIKEVKSVADFIYPGRA